MDFLKVMAVLIEQPFLALGPAIVFFSAYGVLKSRWAFGAGSLWLLYCAYELGMKARFLCSGDCNIRIDLLAIYPALILVSLAAVAAIGVAVFKRGTA